MLTIKSALTGLFLIVQTAGACAIVLPIRSDAIREVVRLGLQPGLAVGMYVDRFLPHFCFAITPIEKWVLPLTVFAINCLAYFFLYRLIASLIHRKRQRA